MLDPAGISTILRPQNSVPEGEIQTKMLVLVDVVHRVVSWTDDPTPKPVMGESNRERFQAQMIHHGPQGHRCQHGKNGADMEG
jgi:hypothetical protein